MALPIDEDPVGHPGTGGGGGGGTVTVGTPIFTLNIVKDLASSVLRVLAYASVSSNDDLQFTGYLSIDGIIRQSGGVYTTFVGARAAMPITLPAYVSGLAAGAHTIIFSIRNQEPDSPLTVLTGSTIEITELKQGAV